MGTSTYNTVWDWFRLWYYMDWNCLLISFLVTIWIGTAFCFPFWVLYWFGTAFLFPFPSTIWVWDCLLYRVLYWFWTGSVSSWECPATVFKKLQSRREALSFTKSIPMLLQNWSAAQSSCDVLYLHLPRSVYLLFSSLLKSTKGGKPLIFWTLFAVGRHHYWSLSKRTSSLC